MMGNNIQYHPALSPEKTAVTLVAHGLNLKPEAMLSLVHWLAMQGSDVYLVRLSGHHSDGVQISEVTAAVWQQEMLQGYKKALKASREASVPLHFLGYSLGALLGQSMIALSMEHTPFDKQVLIAPATAIHPRSYLLKFLFPFGKRRRLRSFSPREYRVNQFLPLHIYEILFTEEKRVLRSGFKKLNIPTLVFIDPKDELVSYKKLRRQVASYSLSSYRLTVLDDSMEDRSQPYHHLVVDEQTMGKRNWEMVTTEIRKFLA